MDEKCMGSASPGINTFSKRKALGKTLQKPRWPVVRMCPRLVLCNLLCVQTPTPNASGSGSVSPTPRLPVTVSILGPWHMSLACSHG